MDEKVLRALLQHRPCTSNPSGRPTISRWQLQQGCSIAWDKDRPDLLLPLLMYLNNFYPSTLSNQHPSDFPVNVANGGLQGTDPDVAENYKSKPLSLDGRSPVALSKDLGWIFSQYAC
ncbi:hypothetical protein M427DRAFT_338137 [Gonapodya prolifera JEL478]|uniref:Uncharacterized protein n=1 Tax=Gonapodya prolifera (strain JEL478) TaxID=1344416 RepID=A0A139ADK9_GONPJ|nr:hypothetical protein M427DRAFT_338137 [Gonapodya prolifera JEL478]|eukprot:KXS14503.1 hypothetical protein M427DRAFT_338137 [Gonapodya prolifera JEL478]